MMVRGFVAIRRNGPPSFRLVRPIHSKPHSFVDVTRMTDQNSPWGEEEYTEYLAHERHMFAWCLVTHGNISWPSALLQAEHRYPYESSTERFRGMIFHDEAWHYAMRKLFGELRGRGQL